MKQNSFEFVWLNKWVHTFAWWAPNAKIRNLARKFLNDWDKETMADDILEGILSESRKNPDDKFCRSVLSSFQRDEAFHEEKCDLGKWVSSTSDDPNFTRNLLESKLADLEREREEILKRLKT